MALSSTEKSQLRAYTQITDGIHKNPNYLTDIMKSIQNNDVKTFNKITGKNSTTIKSAEGYIRLYNAYIHNQMKIKPKSQKQQITAKKTAQKPIPPQKKTTKKAKPKPIDYSLFHPFKASFEDHILDFTLTNQFSMQISTKNLQKFYDFIDNLFFRIQNYNTQKRKKIQFVRISVRYKATDNSTRYYSTKKTNIANIESEAKLLLDSLLTFNPNWYNISPSNQEFIDDLADNTYRIYAFDEIKITYYKK